MSWSKIYSNLSNLSILLSKFDTFNTCKIAVVLYLEKTITIDFNFAPLHK